MRSPDYKFFKTSDEIKLRYRFKDSGKEKTILFLHGFTGSVQDWLEISYAFENQFNVAAIDLIGHGGSDSPNDVKYYSEENVVKQIFEFINFLNLNFLILIGYSMGGRAALSFYFSFPQKVGGLILESVSPGIENGDEKTARLESDLLLAEKIETNGIKPFIDEWMELPLFSRLKNLSEENYDKIVKQKYFNDKTGLANSLRGFGQGKTRSYWKRLAEIDIPVLLLSGEDDEKYTELNKRVHSLIPQSDQAIVNNSGHNIHLQNRDEFINLTKQFLNNHF